MIPEGTQIIHLKIKWTFSDDRQWKFSSTQDESHHIEKCEFNSKIKIKVSLTILNENTPQDKSMDQLQCNV